MTLPCSVALETIALIAVFVLGFQEVVASERNAEDHRQLKVCMVGVSRCYMQYGAVFSWPQLQRNDHGEFNDDAYREACRTFNETSSCYEGSSRCPRSMTSNFTRREEGYRSFRAIVCDTEVFKGAVRARNCTIMAKMEECIREQMNVSNATGVEYEEILCRVLHAEKVCYEKVWNSSCPISLQSAVATINKTLDAMELTNDCKSMYPSVSNAPEVTRSIAVTLSDLAADNAEIKALLRENAQAIASLIDKVKENNEILKQQVGSME